MLTKDPWVRALVIVTLTIATIYLLGLIWQIASQFADIILLFFIAWMLAFIIEPVVDMLLKRGHLPRALATAIAYLGLLAGLVIGILVVIPPLINQIVQVTMELPAYSNRLALEFVAFQLTLEQRGIHLNLESIVDPNELVRRVEAIAPLVLSNALGIATGLASFLFQLVIVVMLSFYLTLDGRRITGLLLAALPQLIREDGLFFVDSVRRAFAGFLQGQLILALTYGAGTAVIMMLAGVPYVLLASVFAALLMLIPILGPFLAATIPVLITLFAQPGATLAVLIASIVLQQIVFNVIAPRVMSQSVGMHPLLVIFALLAGAKVAGIWGALFGVPVVAVATAMVTFYRANLAARRAQLDQVVSDRVEASTPAAEEKPVEVAAR